MRRHALAPVLAAALGGFAVVGLVDSLADIPRLMLPAYALLWLALTLRVPPHGQAAAAAPLR